MEEKINIAKILKNKPQGTKLYDLLYNIDVELDTISITDTETVVWCTNETDNNTTCHHGYSKFGTVRECPDGLQILLPSKEMRDWSKFSWKKGDVLVSRGGTVEVIFDGFDDDDYVTFKGKHALKTIEGESEYKGDSDDGYDFYTENYHLESEDAAQTYINTIEERLGGKLNRETLEIEKARPEFKDGDIITFKDRIIIIYNTSIEKSPIRTEIYYHACLKGGKLTVNEYLMSCGFGEGWSSTEEEKHQLFDALAKEGKAWDAEKKMIVDLNPKVELKAFDKVLVKDNPYGSWEPALFWKKVDVIDLHPYMVIGGKRYRFCEPYEGNEHLLDD